MSMRKTAMSLFKKKEAEQGKAYIFWNKNATQRNRRYWAIAEYHNNGLWLFYWHENNANWVTFKAVNKEYLKATKIDPRAEQLPEDKLPIFYEKMRECGIPA